MEMRFWKPFPRPDLVKIIVSTQVELLQSVLTIYFLQHSPSKALTIVLK